MNFSEWEEVKLEDSAIKIIDGDRGKNYPNGSDFAKNGYCLFLNTKNVTSDGFSFNENMFITKEKDALLKKGKLKREDIVLTTRGTVGNVAYYNNEIKYENIRINSGMVILRCEGSGILPNYGYWLFKSPIIQNQILSIRTGTAQPQLPITLMKNLKFLLPPLSEQKLTANVLSCLEDKIKLNNEINNTLELIAQAIFKHWFIEFEFPNEQGLPYKSSGGEMIDSELGKIPKGWEAGKFKDVLEEITERIKKNNVLKVFSVINTGKIVLSDEFFEKRVYSKDISNYKIVKPKYFAFNPSRINIGSIGMNEFSFSGAISPIYIVFKIKNNLEFYFKKILELNKTRRIINQLCSGTVRQTLSFKNFSSIDIIIPPNEIIAEFNNFILSIKEVGFLYSAQNQILSQIRDLLLPKLMLGKIRINI